MYPAANNSTAIRRQAHSYSWPILTLAWIAVGTVLYFAKPAVAPLLFAVLLALLLSPAVDLLVRCRLPRLAGAFVAVGLLLAAITLIVDAAWSPALRWVDDAPAVIQKVERKVRPLQRFVARVDSVTARATTLTNATSADSPPIITGTDHHALNAFGAGKTVLIDIATVSILTVFLLGGGSSTLRKLESGLATQGRRLQYMRMVESLRNELSRYYSTLVLINIALGLVMTAITALWGLPNPWLWGITAGVLNFIPYIGPTITLLIVTVVAIVSSDGYATALGVAGSFILVTTIEGQIIQLLLVGFRLNLNPIVLFTSIWLAGWFWGVAGVFLATPILISLKEIAARRNGVSILKSVLTRPEVTVDARLCEEQPSLHQLVAKPDA